MLDDLRYGYRRIAEYYLYCWFAVIGITALVPSRHSLNRPQGARVKTFFDIRIVFWWWA